MEIREIKDKKIWEDFLSRCEEKTFLQSWNWGEFQKMTGDKIWRLGVYQEKSNIKNQISKIQIKNQKLENDKKLLAVALVIKVSAKRGRFLFVPHGPIIKSKIKNQKSKILEILLDKLKKIAKEENCSFIRIASIWERTEENERIFKNFGFRKAPIHIHPELTWELDITAPEGELLKGMRKTTRYLIKQGLKNKDLKIETSKNLKDVEIFNSLYQKTVLLHHFVPFSPDYLKKEFLAFSPDNQILIFLAKYRGECLASSFIIFWQGRAFYHQGASCQKYHQIPASYLLQWEAIKAAKKRDCKLYNFWGIAKEKSKFKIQKSKIRKHPWWGLTLFKTGFGGHEREYLRTQDLPLSIFYWLTFFFEKLRKIKRGF